MEQENKYDDLLVKYSLNESSEEERKFVLEWLDASEDNQLYFQSLRDTLELVSIKEETDKIDIDQEWQRFQRLKEADQQKKVGFEERAGDGEEVLLKEGKRSWSVITKLMIAVAVAASLIFALMMTGGFFNNDKSKEHYTAKNRKVRASAEPLTLVLLHEKNITGKVKNIILPDASKSGLFANSSLIYQEPSERTRREVLLKGKAYFKVAKDKTRPFTVFSGDLSTTAVGTEFTITAMPQEKQILVRLHEGRVIVRSTKTSGNKIKDAYLTPGQELVYNVIKGTAILRSFVAKAEHSRKDINKEELLKDEPAVPPYGKRSWFMFNNQPLNEVFDALADMYSVKISYSKMDIRKMYFIGTFDKADSLETILNQIASVNNLTVIKDSSTYRIKKQVLKQKN